jgi:hypothetical protein
MCTSVNLRSRIKKPHEISRGIEQKRAHLAALSAEVESAPPVSGVALRDRRVAEIQNAAHQLLRHQTLSRPGREGGVPKQNNKKNNCKSNEDLAFLRLNLAWVNAYVQAYCGRGPKVTL